MMKKSFRNLLTVLQGACVAVAVLGIMTMTKSADAQTFVHPGILHTRADLDRMRDMVAAGTEPYKSGFATLQANVQSKPDYVMRGPIAHIGRNPTIAQGEFDSDCNAAYQNAMEWAITGDKAYADKSKEILIAWASTLKEITGADAVLMAGLGPFKLVNAAEILRYTNAGLTDADVRQYQTMFREVVYPVIKDFAPFANGNWDTAAMKTMLAIAVFCDDRAMYDRALDYYVTGAGDGRLTHYIYENGEIQESGRDQGHTQLGIGHLGDCCEIAWNQGLDLYAYADNRLLKGFEYTAKYNLGEDVPYIPDLDRTGKYAHSVISARGPFRPIYEQIYNHYVNRRGIPTPYTQRAAEKIRPEGSTQGADHPGFGTILFSRPASSADLPGSSHRLKPEATEHEVSATALCAVSETHSPSQSPKETLYSVASGFNRWSGSAATDTLAPVPPAGIIAHGTATSVKLTWISSIDADSYQIERAVSGNGQRITVGSVQGTEFADDHVMLGTLYQYTITAKNSAGASVGSSPAIACAGLPSGWMAQDIGNASLPSTANFDGESFTIEAAGAKAEGPKDQFHFTYDALDGDGTLTVRFVPQVSSQFTRFGLAIRESLADDAPMVSLLLAPVRAGGSVEVPTWGAHLSVRSTTGGDITVAAPTAGLTAPNVTYGRLMTPYWLRLMRVGDAITGEVSPDGKTWSSVGSVSHLSRKRLLIGLSVSSGMPAITTTVRFDHVELQPK